MVILRALMVKNVLENMSIFIEPATLICGNQASRQPCGPDHARVRDGLGDRRAGRVRQASRRPVHDHRGGQAAACGTSPRSGSTTPSRTAVWPSMPPASKLFYDLGIIHPEGNITSGDAHIAVYYERVLKEGLAGYRARTESLLAGLDLTDAAQLKKSFFYRSVLITLDAVVTFAHRYAALAADLATTEPDEARRAELVEMSRILDQGSRAAGRDVPRGHPGGLADPAVPAGRVQRPQPVLRPPRPVRLPVLRGRPRGWPHHR